MLQILFYILSICLSIGQAGRISFFDQQINIYIFEIILIIISGFLLKKIKFSALFKSSIILIGVLFLSLLIGFWQYSPLQNLVGLGYLIRFALYLGFLVLLTSSTLEIKKMALKSFWILVILVPIFCLIQYVLYPDLRNLYYLGWDPHLSRVFGSFFDSSITGTILVLLFFWNIFNFSKRQIIFHIIVSVITFILILLTYSRISYIEFVTGLSLFAYSKMGIIKTASLIAVFGLLLFFLPRPFGESVKLERIFTIESRIADYKQGLELFSKKPILGYGFDRLKYARNISESSHAGNYSSSFLTILVSSGIFGIIAFIYFLYTLYISISNKERILLTIVLAGSLLDNIFLNNFILLLLFWIIGQSRSLKNAS